MKRIMVEFEKCLGCHSCELACAVSHSEAKSFLGAVMAQELPSVAVRVVSGGGLRFPVQCRHCTDAKCLKACMTGAIHRDEATGAVLCDAVKCVGCWMCVMTCPLGAITEGPDHKAAKCDLCGVGNEPACALACPTGALTYEEIEAYDREKGADYLVNYAKGVK
ncbi:MAG: 4Fe-4S dicluster domain-containing protein [Bacillota bacterium]|nr:4Fe-4S dicluster domain-containing protein [Bacillota bacterium]